MKQKGSKGYAKVLQNVWNVWKGMFEYVWSYVWKDVWKDSEDSESIV